MRYILATALVASVVTAGAAHAAGDPAAGKIVFNKCAICHSPQAGVNKVGPSLHGIVGRHSASIPNFNYSPAMKGVNVTWDVEHLNTYLTDPQAMVPNTRMIFPGLKDEADRQTLIAYLATLK
jgi:cytochrome c